MVAIKLEHSKLAQHQAGIFKQLQAFRKEGQLCDIVVRSRDGTEHGAQTAVLCAASTELKNMLVGPFVEANLVQEGQPVEMAASAAVVFALLEYIYGEEPLIELDDSLELLRLADAYNFPQLAAAIEAGLRASLDSASVKTALKLLQLTQDFHDLTAACEDKIAANFERCIDLADFLELSAVQLGRILRREDLWVSREEVVVKGLFNWFNKSADRAAYFGLLLQHVDFPSLSSDNLARLGHLSGSMGRAGHDLQREVAETFRARKKALLGETPEAFWPRRRCLRWHWSFYCGASWQAPKKVLPDAESICSHDGVLYYATRGVSQPSSIMRWKPGDIESQAVAGRGARVNGVNDLGHECVVSVSLEGEIFVADCDHRRLLSFQNGFGSVVLEDVDIECMFCAPNEALYIATDEGAAVEKLVGETRYRLTSSNDLPAELQFSASNLFVNKDEVIYILDFSYGRVLRMNPGEVQPEVVGEAPNKESSYLNGFFVMEDGQIYVADRGQRKVWTFHPGDAAWTEVLTCPGELQAWDVQVQGSLLYVGICSEAESSFDPRASGIYEYLLPPELQLSDLTTSCLV